MLLKFILCSLIVNFILVLLTKILAKKSKRMLPVISIWGLNYICSMCIILVAERYLVNVKAVSLGLIFFFTYYLLIFLVAGVMTINKNPDNTIACICFALFILYIIMLGINCFISF